MANHALVGFRFIGPAVDPEGLTRLIGVSPTDSHRSGQPMLKRHDRTYGTGFWGIESGLPPTAPVEDHAARLLDLLEPHAGALRGLAASGLIGEFYCSYFIEETEGTVDLSSSTLARIGSLPARLLIAIYCEESDGDE